MRTSICLSLALKRVLVLSPVLNPGPDSNTDSEHKPERGSRKEDYRGLCLSPDFDSGLVGGVRSTSYWWRCKVVCGSKHPFPLPGTACVIVLWTTQGSSRYTCGHTLVSLHASR